MSKKVIETMVFNKKEFKEAMEIITGTAQICVLKHIPVYTIPGDIRNIKITTPEDIKIAENIIKMGEN